MNARTCPRCGTPFGAGALEGMCPKCLVADGSSANTTVEAPPWATRTGSHEGGRARRQPIRATPPGPVESLRTPGFPVGTIRPDRRRPRRPRSGGTRRERRGRRREGRGRAGPTATTCRRSTATKRPRTGHGGQGIVYLAVRLSTKRKVAVKVLRAGVFASEAARRKFEHEIELVTSFKHPNIIAVYDRGCTPDGHDYYTMEYFRGVPITQVRPREQAGRAAGPGTVRHHLRRGESFAPARRHPPRPQAEQHPRQRQRRRPRPRLRRRQDAFGAGRVVAVKERERRRDAAVHVSGADARQPRRDGHPHGRVRAGGRSVRVR